MKKELITLSPSIDPRLAVLDVHMASSSSSQTTQEFDRDIEQLEN